MSKFIPNTTTEKNISAEAEEGHEVWTRKSGKQSFEI